MLSGVTSAELFDVIGAKALMDAPSAPVRTAPARSR
jgi:hypothetical protein